MDIGDELGELLIVRRRVVVTFNFTQSVEFDSAEIVGRSDRELIERARGLVASQYDLGEPVGGAYLLLDDADADLESVKVIDLGEGC